MLVNTKSQWHVGLYTTIGSFMLVVGGFFTFILGVTSIACIYNIIKKTDVVEAGPYSLIFLGTMISMIAFIYGKRCNGFIKTYKSYVFILSQDSDYSLNNISFKLDTPTPVVIYNLKRMLKYKFFTDAYINEKNNILVFNGYNNHKVEETVDTYEEPEEKIEYISVVCKSCGASNKVVKGTFADCEFCGSNISSGKLLE